MRQRLALFVPALGLAAAGALTLTSVLSSSPALASSHAEGSTAMTAEAGMNTNRGEPARDDRDVVDQDKGEHLDLTCWDQDHPATASPMSTASPVSTAAPATTTSTGTIECTWHPATRSDFGGYKLVRTSDTPSNGSTASTTAKLAEAGPKAATNPTLMTAFQSTSRSADQFVDTSVTLNVEYTYQLEVLDSHGNIAVRSEPQTVTDRAQAATPEANVDHLDLDCRTATKADRNDHVTTVCSWNRVDNATFFSFRLTRQVQGSNQAATVVFLTTNRNQTSFTDLTTVRGVDYVYRIEELNRSSNVIARSDGMLAHPDISVDLQADGRPADAR